MKSQDNIKLLMKIDKEIENLKADLEMIIDKIIERVEDYKSGNNSAITMLVDDAFALAEIASELNILHSLLKEFKEGDDKCSIK